MKLTNHARLQWQTRFPELEMEREYLKALQNRIGPKTKELIKLACPQHAGKLTGIFQGYYYRMTRERIVFVMAAGEVVVTVFRLDREEELAA